MKKSFTLIEVLVASALMVVVLATAAAVMVTVLRSARKSSAIAAAKTQGEYALGSMDQMIRFAVDISCPAVDSVMITRANKDTVRYYLNGSGIASEASTLVQPAVITGTQNLTSNQMVVTACPGGIFNCSLSTDSKSVSICFVINEVAGIDVTDTAGAAGITFSTQVSIRNLGNN